MPAASITIEGLDLVMARLRADLIAQRHLRAGLEAVGLLLVSEARKRAPVDRGPLRASIAHKVDPSAVPLFVEIGHLTDSAAPYAPYMEFGTGLVHDHPSWPRRVPMVPPRALEGWARRHGANPFAVARAIPRRGGLTPRRYLRGALEDNQSAVVRIVAGALRRAGET